jgi:hypothetical protein
MRTIRGRGSGRALLFLHPGSPRTARALGEPLTQHRLVLGARLLGHAAGLSDLLDSDAQGKLAKLAPRMNALHQRRIELDAVAGETLPIDIRVLDRVEIDRILVENALATN